MLPFDSARWAGFETFGDDPAARFPAEYAAAIRRCPGPALDLVGTVANRASFRYLVGAVASLGGHGPLGGMAAVPQSFDKRYFTVSLSAPPSGALDRPLHVHLKYPRDVPEGFVKDFEGLVEGFDRHVRAPGK